MSRRQDRPDAIAWLLRNHPELSDAQISKLVGTTKPTIQAIRDRTHWNQANITPVDPVSLGLCSQIDLDAQVKKADARAARERAKQGLDEPGDTLRQALTSLATHCARSRRQPRNMRQSSHRPYVKPKTKMRKPKRPQIRPTRRRSPNLVRQMCQATARRISAWYHPMTRKIVRPGNRSHRSFHSG